MKMYDLKFGAIMGPRMQSGENVWPMSLHIEWYTCVGTLCYEIQSSICKELVYEQRPDLLK